jgi:Fe(3+) dicitrate transport protein
MSGLVALGASSPRARRTAVTHPHLDPASHTCVSITSHRPAPGRSRSVRASTPQVGPLLLGVIFLLALPPTLLGQSGEGDTGRIEGRIVSSEDGAPVPGASIQLDGLDRTVGSDRGGYFYLRRVPAGTVRVSVGRLGFASQSVEVEVAPEGRTSVEVSLSPQPVGLDPIVARARRTRMVGDPLNLNAIPGSAHFLSLQDLDAERLAFDNVHEMLRRIPGVNIQDEDGYGLRPNIGMRGTGVERSSKVTLMEDGILIAPAPYAAPAAYYFPVAARMEGIEVRKGSSQVRYGPRTIGGAINLVSASIPDRPSFRLDTQGGGDRSMKGQLRAGDSGDHFGWMVETYQIGTDGFKELASGNDTGFRVSDYLAKFRLNTDREAPRYQEVELKVGYHDELSHETYLGLTQEDFSATPLLRYPASEPDRMDTEHTQLNLRHFFQPRRNLDITTSVYRHGFDRNWYKLQSVQGTSIANVLAAPGSFPQELAILKGSDSEADAFRVRANNRSYLSRGVQSLVGLRMDRGRVTHDLEFGVRLHQDEEDRFQWEDGYQMLGGTPVLTSEGTPGAQANRVSGARALSLHAQDEIEIGRLTLVPGARWEHIRLTRTDYSTEDPDRSAPSDVRELTVSSVIPSLGATLAVTPSFHLFGGVHKGFGPPGPGAAEETRPEESVNYEVGSRLRSRGLALQLTGFFSDYRNILGEATLATGDSGVGRLFNGGEVHTLGIETSLDYDLAAPLDLPVRLPFSLAYTYTRATFQTAFRSDFGPWGTVERGDHLPYLPTHQGSGSLAIEEGDWRVSVTGRGASAMRTRAGQGPVVELESTDRHLILNLQGEYTLPTAGDVAIHAGVQNLADHRYVAARRPAGALPGLPRTLFIGVRVHR